MLAKWASPTIRHMKSYVFLYFLYLDLFITFSLTSSSYGLIEERLVVTNQSCTGQRHEILIRLFVDDSSLLTNLPISHTGVDWLRFDDIYVAPQTMERCMFA